RSTVVRTLSDGPSGPGIVDRSDKISRRVALLPALLGPTITRTPSGGTEIVVRSLNVNAQSLTRADIATSTVPGHTAVLEHASVPVARNQVAAPDRDCRFRLTLREASPPSDPDRDGNRRGHVILAVTSPAAMSP